MTRDFNKQRRDDSRPSFRKPSSNGYGDTRSPRPARPRLNRETVDRAWESGAQTNHADYHPRPTGGQSPYRGSGNGRYPNRDNQQNQHTSHTAYGNDGNRRENYRDNSRNAERSFDKGPGPRSFDGNRRNFDGPRTHDSRHYSDGSHSRDYRGTEAGEPRNAYRGRDQRQGYAPRNGEHDSRPGQRKPWEQRDTHSGPPRDFRPSPNNRRSPYPSDQRNSRPPGRDSFQNARPRRPSQGQFEGDYERFDSDERPGGPRPHSRFGPPRGRNSEAEERAVTRLPDGRVLKGPRPAQRKNAQFWTGIAADKDELLDHVQVPATEEIPLDDQETEGSHVAQAPEMDEPPGTGEQAGTAASAAQGRPTETPRRSRPHVTSAVARRKKSAAKGSRPASTGPKPSQRGFKWPTP